MTMNLRAGLRVVLPAASLMALAGYLAGALSAVCMLSVISGAGGLFVSLRLSRAD
jgi:hypothetical protein